MIDRPPSSGWYLMATGDLERELKAWREPDSEVPASDAVALTIEQALTIRAAGNLPDDEGRTLRLLLRVDRLEPGAVERERLRFEPDFHDAPSWRVAGSKPINVVPLVAPGSERPHAPDAWWDDPTMDEMERTWSRTGAVEGLLVPAEWRGFVFKTVASLRAAGRPVTVGSVVGSVSRWLGDPDVLELERALRDANR